MTLPLVDLSAADAVVERELDDHLRHTGFLLVTGHGVDPALVAATRAMAARLFALDDATKLAFRPAADGAPGYYPLATGSLARTLGEDGPPDLKESFTTGPLHDGSGGDPALARWFPGTRWPDVPGFADTWSAYYRAMDGLATRLLSLFARALDLPSDRFAAACRNPTSTLSAVHYPGGGTSGSGTSGNGTSGNGTSGNGGVGSGGVGLRAGAHSDYGTLTILHKQPGADDLEVRGSDGSWSRLRPAPEQFVVNTGDLLAQWTNDRWVSTVHRVVVPGPDPSVSLGFFHQPDADALVEALPSCVSAERPARYAPVRAGEHLAAKMTRQHAGAPT